MGVPAFFRWLCKKYPSVIVDCIEEKPQQVGDETIPVDTSQPNPNNVEFDNLYLDMNGIIHPCTHPEDKPAPKDEDEMMVAIFECIDRLFRIVRPRRLLYMAIDGVAPRAKMNQQRSRRFRASKEAVEKIDEMARIREDLRNKGAYLPPEKEKGSHFDSNCITPGTPFMDRLSKCLHYYIHDRLNNDPGWKNVKVILSDANVPGEGEHKIMDYIRRQRAQPDHDPNTKHCLCGADADLIMLGLATHEPNFTIIREEFLPNKPRPCDICRQTGHEMKDCTGLAKPCEDNDIEPTFGAEQQFIFVRLCVLREYLAKELDMPNLPFPYDLERAIDDWVFMCFFVGNDFLPHLPSLEIRENAIDRLINLYKKTVYKTGGFLTDSGNVNLDRVQLIMADLGDVEDEIFKERQDREIAFRQRNKAKKRRMRLNEFKPQWVMTNQFAPMALGSKVQAINNPRQEAFKGRVESMQVNQALESMLKVEGTQDSQGNRGEKRKASEMGNDSDDEEPPDEVRLWEDGFKDRYYESKFDVAPDNIQFRYNVGHEYVYGLCWVLKYYYQGCASWKWYFPYHYAPFASDFLNIGELSSEFEKGTQPFHPLEQLMSVFPAASRSHVPEPWAELMTDPFSPIIDFYPEDFKIDLNGKKFAWQGVALLPFVEEKRLFKALKPYYGRLTAAERKRNIRGENKLYINKAHKGYKFFAALYENGTNPSEEIPIDGSLYEGMRGTVLLSDICVPQGESLESPVGDLLPVEDNRVLCISFRDPKYPDTFVFPARKLVGAEDPPKVLKPEDLSRADSRAWRPQIGMAPSTQRGYLGAPGHRMLDRQMAGAGMYSNVPPPLMNDRRGGGGYGNNRRSWDGNNARPYSGHQRSNTWDTSRNFSDGNRGRSSYNRAGLGYGRNSGDGSQDSYQGSGNSFRGSRGSYGGSRGSYGDSRGSYQGSGGSYGGSRGSYGGSRGSYGGSRGSYGGSRGSYQDSRSSYQGSRGSRGGGWYGGGGNF